MVQLVLSDGARAAVDEYCQTIVTNPNLNDASFEEQKRKISRLQVGGPIDHHDLVEVSTYLIQRRTAHDPLAKQWRLEYLLKGASIFEPPPQPQSEPTPEYHALMRRLRKEEEQRQYDLMLSGQSKAETFNQRFTSAKSGPGEIGQNADIVDEVSYADVNRQMILIINVLVSIICCSVAIWLAARRWSVPQRLGLSFSGSTIVAAAEVAIYLGYIKRIKDAKVQESKREEKKEIIDTWVIDANPDAQRVGSKGASIAPSSDSLRQRKGKYR